MSDVTQRIERLQMYVQSHPAKDYIDEVKWLCRLALAQDNFIGVSASSETIDDRYRSAWKRLDAARRDPA